MALYAVKINHTINQYVVEAIIGQKSSLSFIIIISCWQHGYPWPSLATPPYRSSPEVGLQDNNLYPHIAAECTFVLVVLLLRGHVWGSIRVHLLWVHLCFSSNRPACLVRLTWIVFVIGGRWPYSWCLVGCCCQDLFRIARSILGVIAI